MAFALSAARTVGASSALVSAHESTPTDEEEEEVIRLKTIEMNALKAVVLAGVLGLFAACGSDAEAHISAWKTSLATQFGHKCTAPEEVYNCTKPDRWAGSQFACGGKMDASVWGIAARTLPCGTIVEIRHRNRRIIAPVVDSGPFWAIPKGCNKLSQACWVRGRPIPKRRLDPTGGWQFASDLDLLPGPAFALGLGGRGLVSWRVVHVPSNPRFGPRASK